MINDLCGAQLSSKQQWTDVNSVNSGCQLTIASACEIGDDGIKDRMVKCEALDNTVINAKQCTI